MKSPGLLLMFVALLTASVSAEEKELEGWLASFTAVPVKEGLFAKEVSVPLPGILDGETFVIPDVVFTAEGRVLSSGRGTKPVEIRGINGFRAVARSYAFGPRGLALGGTVFVPQALGSAEVVYPPGTLWLEPDGALIAETSTTAVQLATKPFPQAAKVSFGRAGMTLQGAKLLVPGWKISPPMGLSVFSADGSLVSNLPSTDDAVSLEDGGFLVDNARGFRIGQYSIEFSGALHLPPPFQNQTQDYGTMYIREKGRLGKDYSEHQGYSFPFQGFWIDLPQTMNFTSDGGLQVEGAAVRLPEALGGGSMTFVSGVSILPNRFDTYGFSTGAVTVFGAKFLFDEVGFDASGLVAQRGWLSFPKALGGGLGGTSVYVKSARFEQTGMKELQLGELRDEPVLMGLVPLTGAVLHARLQDRMTLSLEGSLPLAQSLGSLWSLPVSELPLDLENNRFDFDHMRLAPVRFDWGGLSFDLGFSKVSRRFDLVLSGTARVIDQKAVEAVRGFRGKTLNVDGLRLNSAGQVTVTTLSVPGQPDQSYYFEGLPSTIALKRFDRSNGLPAALRVRVNQDEVVTRTHPSLDAPVVRAVPEGTTLATESRSLDVEAVEDHTDYWYRLKGSTPPEWIYGGYFDVLR